jgi:hypothetical protein
MKNMKKLVYLFSLLSLWMATSVSAQSLKKQEATMEDYLPLLQASGYQVYSFDISDFLDDTYHFSFKIKEYVNREEVQRDGHSSVFPNRMMLAEFPEESQKRILEKGSAADPEKGIYSQAKKLTIGFIPSKVDSTQFVRISLDGMGEIRTPLKLKPLKASKGDELSYNYESRPFVVDKFEEGKFIPLVFFGSYWVDEEYGFLRFCGAMEIGADMGQEYIESTPHYYAIGVEINKKK